MELLLTPTRFISIHSGVRPATTPASLGSRYGILKFSAPHSTRRQCASPPWSCSVRLASSDREPSTAEFLV